VAFPAVEDATGEQANESEEKARRAWLVLFTRQALCDAAIASAKVFPRAYARARGRESVRGELVTAPGRLASCTDRFGPNGLLTVP
jgi:hypothetical protein